MADYTALSNAFLSPHPRAKANPVFFQLRVSLTLVPDNKHTVASFKASSFIITFKTSSASCWSIGKSNTLPSAIYLISLFPLSKLQSNVRGLSECANLNDLSTGCPPLLASFISGSSSTGIKACIFWFWPKSSTLTFFFSLEGSFAYILYLSLSVSSFTFFTSSEIPPIWYLRYVSSVALLVSNESILTLDFNDWIEAALAENSKEAELNRSWTKFSLTKLPCASDNTSLSTLLIPRDSFQ